MKPAMTIRLAETQDVPAIVALLKQSLGEVSSAKTEAYWQWKHIANPFGSSPVYVASDGEQLIGVRAMMRWQWQTKTELYISLRAVDTATHPQHQGKGVFKALTQHLLELAKTEDYAFVFNTPNEHSLPGYLKMGWQVFSKAPVFIKPIVGFSRHTSEKWAYYQQVLQLVTRDEFSYVSLFPHLLHTPKTWEYFNWRYKQCPFQDYGYVSGFIYGLPFGIVIKRKKRGRFYELRVCDYWLADADCFPLMVDAAVKAARETGCLFLSMCLTGLQKKRSFQKLGFISIEKKSPVITMKPIQARSVFTVKNVTNWHFHVGDLELF